MSDDDAHSDSDAFLRAVARAPEKALDVPALPSAPLERLGHFVIEEEIGRGGMGIVVRAVDERLRRTVALKILPEDFDDDEERRRRFLREARVAASIAHPNVAAVHDVGEADGRIFIAMELVRGETLRRRMDAGPLPIADAVRIVGDVARGLSRAHERGVAHRDLKPDNVMLDEEGAVKILDFGLAKPVVVSDGDADHVTRTQEGRIVGTPGYMSPEQATGRPVDVRTDVFAMGVMLYEMLAGERPFRGDTSMDVLMATSRDPHAPASQKNPAVPAALEAVIDRCLSKKPLDRFADASELSRALEASDVVIARAERSGRSQARLVAIVGLAAAGAAAIVIGTRAQPTRSATAEPLTPSATPAAVVATATMVTAPEPPPTQPPTQPPAPAPTVSATTPSRTPLAKTPAKPLASASSRPAAEPPPVVTVSRGGVIETSPY